jgi:hypothetical protein
MRFAANSFYQEPLGIFKRGCQELREALIASVMSIY